MLSYVTISVGLSYILVNSFILRIRYKDFPKMYVYPTLFTLYLLKDLIFFIKKEYFIIIYINISI